LTRREATSVPQEDDRIDVRLQLEDRTYKWYEGVVVSTRDQKVSKTVRPVEVFKVKFDPDSPNALALQTWVNLTSEVATVNLVVTLTTVWCRCLGAQTKPFHCMCGSTLSRVKLKPKSR
jgi:hypothetical protein